MNNYNIKLIITLVIINILLLYLDEKNTHKYYSFCN